MRSPQRSTGLRLMAGFGLVATLVAGQLAAAPAASAVASCSAATTNAVVAPADHTECLDVVWDTRFGSQDECDAAGQGIADRNKDVPTWYCTYDNGTRMWTLHILVCALVDDVDETETWINGNSGLYLDVTNQSKDDGAAVHQWTCTGAKNQRWLRVLGPDDYYRVINANSGSCLGVLGASQGNGTQIVQWTCNGNYDQQWSYRYAGTQVDGWPVYHVVDRNSGKCLGVIGGSTAVGGNVVQWDCNGHPDQNWH